MQGIDDLADGIKVQHDIVVQVRRLRVQLDGDTEPARVNQVELETLNAIDRRVLKESFRIARQLQQRIELDYQR